MNAATMTIVSVAQRAGPVAGIDPQPRARRRHGEVGHCGGRFLIRSSCVKSSGLPGSATTVVGAETVEDDRDVASPQHRLQIAGECGGVRNAGEERGHVGRADVVADGAGGLRVRR